MNKRLIYFIGILFTILLGVYSSLKLCCSYKANNERHVFIEVEGEEENYINPALYPFNVKDVNGDFSLSVNDNFNFERSDSNFLHPVSSSLDVGIGKLKDYLVKENKYLSVIGYYTDNENNNSTSSNLGLARAISIKNYLISKGIPSKIISIYGEAKNEMISDLQNVYHGPLNFNILELKDSSKEIAESDKYIKAHPLILYFKKDEASINLTQEEKKEIANIAKYLTNNEGSSCLIIAHTDNTGNVYYNLDLGKKRADFVKQYLVNKGILSSRIKAISKGEAEPVADNNTEESKAKNRRTVITIK